MQITSGARASGDGDPTLGAAPAALAVGALLLAGILARSLPTLAGFLASLSSVLAVAVLVPLAGMAAGAAVLVPVLAAAGGYAAEPRRRIHRSTPAVVVLVFAVSMGVMTACAADAADWRTVVTAAGVTTLSFAILGLFGGLVHAWTRACARSAETRGVVPARSLLVDEFVPGRSATRLTAGDLERERLATEMHSGVMPDLSAVIRDLESGAGRRDVATRLRDVAADLRGMMSERRNAPLEVCGLLGGLELLAERIEERHGVIVDLDVRGAVEEDGGRPPRLVESAIYRIAEEALHNAVTHAHAERISIGVTVGPTHVALEVADDGVGLAAGAMGRAVESGHLGIADMRARARLVGATLRVTSEDGQGTHVTAEWSA